MASAEDGGTRNRGRPAAAGPDPASARPPAPRRVSSYSEDPQTIPLPADRRHPFQGSYDADPVTTPIDRAHHHQQWAETSQTDEPHTEPYTTPIPNPFTDMERWGLHPRTEPVTMPVTMPASEPPARQSSEPRTAGKRAKPATGQPVTSVQKKRASPPKTSFHRFCVRPARLCGRGLAIVVPIVVLALGLVYTRLLYGPISVGFLVLPIERGLNAEVSGLSFDIDDAVLRLSRWGGVEFRLQNLRVNDAHGGLIGVSSLVGVEISPTALLTGRIAATRIDLIEPRVVLSSDDQGNLSVSITTEKVDGAAGATAGKGTKANPAELAPSSPATKTPAAGGAGETVVLPPQRLDLARAIADAIARSRRSGDTASYLKAIGFRDASIIIEDQQRRAVWSVPRLDVHFDHRQKRSVISGTAKVASGGEPWTIGFRAEDSDKARTINVETTIEGLVPSSLVRNLPGFTALRGVDVPVSGKGTIELTSEGQINDGHIGLRIHPGQIFLPWLNGVPLGVDEGWLDIRYVPQARRFEVERAALTGDRNRIVLVGAVEADPTRGWRYGLRSVEGTVAATDVGGAEIPIDWVSMRGRVGARAGQIEVEEFRVKAGDAEISASGIFEDASGYGSANFDGRIGPMPVATLIALWPRALSPRARKFAGEHVSKGNVLSGSFKIAGATATDPSVRLSPQDGRRFSLSLETGNIEAALHPQMPPLEISRALMRVEGNSLELTLPDAQITTPAARKIAFKSGRVTIVDIDKDRPVAEATIRMQAPVQSVIEMLDREPFGAFHGLNIPLAGIDGKVDAQMRLTLPVSEKIALAEAQYEGKIKITDGRSKDILGSHDISAATIAIDVTEKAIETKGELMVSGVLAKLNHQWIADAADGRQPPLRIALRLDAADRTQLGMDLEHIVHGEVPVEVLVERNPSEQPTVRVNADLTGAEIELNDLSWKKPTGRSARLTFDVGKPKSGKGLELQNFKLLGDNVALDGWVTIGPDNKARQYYFRDFSLNVITNLEVRGTFRPDHVWEVLARGKTYDARDMFRSLLAFGQTAAPVQKNRPGLDLTAEVETVLGANDATLRQVKITMQKRAERLTALDMKGTLESGVPLTASVRPGPGKSRTFIAESSDAGQALKLVGMYASMVGGHGVLNMNLDAEGAADKTGTLSVRRFSVLGDTVVGEVLQNADEGRPAIEAGRRANRRVVREQFDFDKLNAKFSMGSGQIALENAVVTGPLVGASLVGKLDFRTQRMHLGGTYVPLSALSRAIAPIPIIGFLLAGPKGDGVLGITFAIEGAMADPQVIVNPLSLMTPGILREIFQMAPENPRVTPRAEAPAKAPKGAGPQVRSSAPTDGTMAGNSGSTASEIGDGWSTTDPKPTPSRRKQN